MSGAAGENRPAKTPAGVLPPPRKYGIIPNTCRRDGIGRRDGLKIRWANHPCGFESHHRHQKSMARKPSNIKGLRAFFFAWRIGFFSMHISKIRLF